MAQVLAGALAMGFATVAIFFVRFWRETHDRLFALFALAFAVMAVNRVQLSLAMLRGFHREELYWVRVVAFGLILLAILDKNRIRKPTPSSPTEDTGSAPGL
jgi:dihydrodipicolinate synthase/N-acetylneuraminate lyase